MECAAAPASDFRLINLLIMNPYSLWWALCPLLIYCSLEAQNSPFPILLDYGGGALDSTYSLSDSSFCKGSILLLRGSDLASTGIGDTFDSLVVHIDTFPCQIVQLDTSSNTGIDSLIFQIPDIFVNDTCLTLYLVKYISNSFGQFPYIAIDTICLIGDFAQIEYPDQRFCIGDTNPLPTTFTTTDTLGSFCCYTASPGFLVLDNGEIPLHPGAIGLGQSFHYLTTHAACPDTISFQVDILPPTNAVATYSGGNSASYCPSGVVLADTGSLFPLGGHFLCLDSGLVILDDSLGVIDLGASVPGTYNLAYRVVDPCVDSARITIEIMPFDSVAVGYPIPYQGPYQRVCPNQPPIAPLFLSGQAGGDFVALPNSLVLDSNGTIDPALSIPGNYTVLYISPGLCPDTSVAALNLTIDTLPDAAFVILQEEVCGDDSILIVDTIHSPGMFEVLDQGAVIFNTTPNAIPISGLLSPNRTYLIRHISTGPYCADTAYDYLTILEPGNANFTYDPNFYCLGDADPIPLIFGNGGGIFQGVSGNTVVDSLGRIDLGTSGPGLHFIQYTSPGLCPDSLVDTVQINNSVNAFFSYPASQFCKTDSPPIPQTTSTGGIFFTNDSGLSLDSLSGMIDLQSSTPGLYEVTHSFIGSCQTSYSTNLLVLDFPVIPTLKYPSDSFCRGEAPPLPMLNTDSSGAFLGNAGVVFLNPVTGAIDLSLMQAGGPYHVTYDIANPCATDPTDTFFVLEAPFLDFSYSTNAVCQDAVSMDPNIQLQPFSQLSFTATNGLTLSPNGTITPNQSQTGSFVIHCQTNSLCPAYDSAEITIYPLPQSPLLNVLPDTILCTGEGISATLTATDGIGFRFLLNGQLIDSTFFRIDLDQLDHGDTLTGIIENIFGCTDTLHQKITVLNRPSLSIDPPPESILESGFQQLKLTTDIDNTSVDWFLNFSSGTIDSGSIASFDQTNQQPISITGAAQSLDPALYQFQAIPSALGCQGDTLFASYIFLESHFFVPEVITPNGDGKNDQWQVVWRDQIDPSQYEVLVFNRAGGEVHRMAATSSWDGGTVPDGVYWWLIHDQTGQELQKGGLTIRRK